MIFASDGHMVMVAPREGCVSRNFFIFLIIFTFLVAPREGCVSRNFLFAQLLEQVFGCTP